MAVSPIGCVYMNFNQIDKGLSEVKMSHSWRVKLLNVSRTCAESSLLLIGNRYSVFIPVFTTIIWDIHFLSQVNAAVPADNGESKEYHGGTNNREYILDDDECPLAILMNHPSSRGELYISLYLPACIIVWVVFIIPIQLY